MICGRGGWTSNISHHSKGTSPTSQRPIAWGAPWNILQRLLYYVIIWTHFDQQLSLIISTAVSSAYFENCSLLFTPHLPGILSLILLWVYSRAEELHAASSCSKLMQQAHAASSCSKLTMQHDNEICILCQIAQLGSIPINTDVKGIRKSTAGKQIKVSIRCQGVNRWISNPQTCAYKLE